MANQLDELNPEIREEGVDTNVITSERIREEFQNGKTIDGAIQKGYQNAISSIVDGNVTNVIVAIVLLAAFGTPDSLLGKIFGFLFPFLSSSVSPARALFNT